jgi:hypothetical protein
MKWHRQVDITEFLTTDDVIQAIDAMLVAARTIKPLSVVSLGLDNNQSRFLVGYINNRLEMLIIDLEYLQSLAIEGYNVYGIEKELDQWLENFYCWADIWFEDGSGNCEVLSKE